MEYGAIDLHKKDSQIRILREGGEIIARRIATTRDRLTAVFWGRPRKRILLEAATESEWVAQHLETLGHEVIVADPNSLRDNSTIHPRARATNPQLTHNLTHYAKRAENAERAYLPCVPTPVWRY